MNHAVLSQCVHEGAEARRKRKASTACPYGASEGRYRSAWLAGWHDQDIALSGNRYVKEGKRWKI